MNRPDHSVPQVGRASTSAGKWRRFGAVTVGLFLFGWGGAGTLSPPTGWRSLPDLPGAVGFAGMYAGRSHDGLLAAGGANFSPVQAGEESRKIWYDEVYLLREGADAWEVVGRMPRRGGYGVSAMWAERVVCVAGSDAQGPYGEAWMMEWTPAAGLTIEALPALPVAAEMAAGTVVGDTLYVVVEGDPLDDTKPRLYTLRLSASVAERQWVGLAGPPGARARKLAVAAAGEGRLYLFGGLAPEDAAWQRGESRHLRDAYSYAPAEGWRRLADLPRGVAGGAGPAMALAGERLAIWGGLDAPWVELSRRMACFEAGFVVYDIRTDTWTMPTVEPVDSVRWPSRLTATVVPWQGGYAVVGGETAPKVRTPTIPWIDFRSSADAAR